MGIRNAEFGIRNERVEGFVASTTLRIPNSELRIRRAQLDAVSIAVTSNPDKAYHRSALAKPNLTLFA